MDRLDRRLHRHAPHPMWVEVPPTADARPRYGYGRPRHARLAAILARHDGTFRAELEGILEFTDDLRRISLEPGGASEPYWSNPWLPGLDVACLYSFVRRRRPARYLEVGSGNSTAVVARARRDGSLDTEITSIDPSPRREIDSLCDRVVRQPLELVDLDLFRELESGDVVFVDGSHRAFMNSDAVAVYLDLLPDLPDGVLVGIHDILWPDDYFPGWSEYWWNEQYVLGALLLGEPPWLQPMLATYYAFRHPELGHVLDPLWQHPELAGVNQGGTSFWLRVDRSGRPSENGGPR
ncbi:MAG TPA: class I SAM-dependent methyltransferase [Acidimicrobiia bacterium]|nr:class I SAM-dependent methyltransferase [Acidimicrobiia bacterium]